MRIRAIGFLMLAGLAGCEAHLYRTSIPERDDLSTTRETAVIEGSTSGVNGWGCYVSEPGNAKRLVIDAGIISISVDCTQSSGGGSVRITSADFEFDAQAGHIYRLIGFTHGCFGCGKSSRLGFDHLDMIDVSDDKRLVLRRPLMGIEWGLNRSTSMAFAVTASGTIPCRVGLPVKLRDGQGSYGNYHRGLALEPGQIAIMVRCIKLVSPFFKHWVKYAYESEIVFEAQAGHLYSFELQRQDNNCVQVTDVTTDELTRLVCQPAKQLDELIGLTWDELRNR